MGPSGCHQLGVEVVPVNCVQTLWVGPWFCHNPVSIARAIANAPVSNRSCLTDLATLYSGTLVLTTLSLAILPL